MKLSMIFLALFSIGASASTDNTTTVYDKSSRCELDNKSLILYSTLNGVKNNIQNLTPNTKLSSFKAKNYCLLYDSNKNGTSSVKAYNKGTAETFDFSSFWKAKESPNGKYLAVIETDEIQDGRSFVKSINILDKDGRFHINHKFENIYDSQSFFFEFSHDNKYLNFFKIDEFSVEYTSVDLSTKKVHDSLANYQEFSKLTEEQRQYFYDLVSELETILNEQLLELPQWKRELSENLRALRKDTIEQAIKPMLKKLEHHYNAELGVLKYLREMRPELVKAVMELLPDESEADKNDKGEEPVSREIFIEEFVPNVLVHHETMSGAPIIFEPNPSYGNLFGRVEYSSAGGSLYTNYRMIRPGALHKANGGYLILDADRLLSQPAVWDALKLALKAGEVVIDTLSDHAVTNSTIITPRAIPLNVKVVLLGSRDLYYLVQDFDEEFNELFRVLADFEHYLPFLPQTLTDMTAQVLLQLQEMGLQKLSNCGLQQLLLFSFRQAEHQRKLSARFADVLELVREACFYARQQQADELTSAHVRQALAGKKYRTGRISEAFLEDIQEGHILIDTDGLAVGKINGLTVLEIGDTAFGTPARISATVFAGSSGVVDIEREVELGKAIHSKGVLLLTGYLGAKYARDFPLTLSANIAMEQSYGHIDGDSASLAEVCALISAITEIPIKQSLAVTGSINQYGQVQAIGGVNEKIEGYFRLCQSRGLTGEQGVIIPASNQLNLVLDQDVVTAVAAGQFHIYTVKTVDQALELLTGEVAGERNSRGQYPKKSVNGRALLRLAEIAELVNGSSEE
jgi:predicted ATP-dependent protease